MQKSFVTMEQHQCFVCGKVFDTGNILMDRRLKNSFESKTLTGTSLCEEHEKLSKENYVALIVVKDDGKTRTGNFVHIRKEVADKMFDVPLTKNIAFIDESVFAMLQDLSKQTLEDGNEQ